MILSRIPRARSRTGGTRQGRAKVSALTKNYPPKPQLFTAVAPAIDRATARGAVVTNSRLGRRPNPNPFGRRSMSKRNAWLPAAVFGALFLTTAVIGPVTAQDKMNGEKTVM